MQKMKCGRVAAVAMAALVGAAFSAVSSAAILYSDDFSTDTSASYNINITQGAGPAPSGDATFAYNYGAAPGSGGLSIPPAPHTTDSSTLGLRLRTDNLESSVGTVVGATEIATKGLTLTAPYSVSVDVWSNYIGGSNISASGSNGSTGVAVGIGTSGTSLQYIAGNDGLLMEGFGDNGGGANNAYRVYVNNTHALPTTANYWSAGTGSTSASNTDPYYSFMGPVSAPAAQVTFAPTTQGGSTPAGVLGFAWHNMQVANDGTNTKWYIDGVLITTVPDSAYTTGGSQVSLGNDDTGLTGNSAANNQLFNAEIFDNLVVTDTVLPEPASMSLLGLAAVGLLARRRK